jgi:four helix bundle protein
VQRRGFRDLAAYRKSVELADEIACSVERWPSFSLWTVGVQLVRAADSVGANLAEAYGRWGEAERRRVHFVARGSLCELEHWLLRAAERQLPSPPSAIDRAHEIGRMLNRLARSWKAPLPRTED